jgi:heat shock protein HslJ
MVPLTVGSRPAMITFGEDGRFSGSTGCNNYFGQFSPSSDGLASGPIGSTMMMCPEPLMVQERRVLDALEATRRIEFDHDTLALVGADGVAVVEAQRSDHGPDDDPS